MSLLQTLRRYVRPRERELLPITREVKQERLTYLSREKLSRIERALRDTRDVPGDVVEFGVALGGSAIILAHQSPAAKRFFGLDVFAMIPPPTSEKDDEKSINRYEVIKSGASEGIGGDDYYGYRPDLFGDVSRAMERHGVPVDGERVHLIKGLFEDSWPTLDVGRISLAHIDCDWYDPVRYCLAAVADKLSVGGILVIDDYNDYGGCRTAVDEILGENGNYRMEEGANPFLVRTTG